MNVKMVTWIIWREHLINIGPRSHGFPRDPGECPVRGPQKLSEELERSEEFRGQFLRSEDWTFPRVPRKTVGPFHYTLVMPVYHFLLLISNVPQLRKRGTLGRLFFNVPHFLRKTWDIGSTVFQCPPLFAPMSHVLWNYPGKCPVLLLRVKWAKPGYNAQLYPFGMPDVIKTL